MKKDKAESQKAADKKTSEKPLAINPWKPSKQLVPLRPKGCKIGEIVTRVTKVGPRWQG